MSDISGSRVRLTVSRIDLRRPRVPGELLLDLDVDSDSVVERATAWAEVRGYERLKTSLEQMFDGPPPSSGFRALINKPHSVLVLATWPWAPDGSGHVESS